MEDAEKAKAEGNTKFKSQDFGGAVEAYTKSLELNPEQHICYSNRCAAYLKLGGSDDKALADARKCVELMPTWAKGYHRVCEALRQLKRSSEATDLLQAGLAVVEGEGREGLLKLKNDVPKWQFCDTLRGTWHGKVNDVLGGYAQEMEFLDIERIRVKVLEREMFGKYSVDVTQKPYNIDILVYPPDLPPGYPSPPAVPYIAKTDDSGLHLCCPYLTMDRPRDFSGPGYVLMRVGPIPQAVNAEVEKLSRKEKLQRCCEELLATIPHKDLEHSPGDTEAVAAEKLMMQVRFQSHMFEIETKYGKDIIETVMNATRGTIPKELEGCPAIPQIIDKMKLAGIVQNKEASSEVQQASSSSEGKPSEKACPPPDASGSTDERDEVQRQTTCSALVGGVLVSAAVLALGLILSRRRRL